MNNELSTTAFDVIVIGGSHAGQSTAVRNFSRYYLGGISANDPVISPRNGASAGLPALFIQASDTEVLLDDDARVADKARTAGVPENFKVLRRLPHAWATLAPLLPETKSAIRETAGFIREVTP
ncbi:acetyl esterase/lipase [Burkholderia ambifaria]|nr:alpha/beta hydrolase fold domain-containing protein [Burkholderia ambifaria]MDR6504219.1 acetyl esterase/lipase [Burkholderia ambifaria]